MGQIITQFVHQRRNLPEISFFTDKSLSKVQQFYQNYKYSSDTFAIDDTVFKDIFGQLHPVFQVLDSNSSLLIDGLQLFSALSLFSKLIKLQDKIQFIFKIFDFNELRSLSITDTEFMILTCCSVTHKLLGIKSSLRDDIIMSFVHEQFQAFTRVNISQFKKWGITSNIVTKFINLIYNQQQQIFRNFPQQEQKLIKSLLSEKIYRSYLTCSRNQLGSLFYQNSRLTASKQILQKQTKAWFALNRNLIDYDNIGPAQSSNTTSNQNKITINKKTPKISSDLCDFTLLPNWIYGIRYKDVKYFINYIDQNQIVYFVGKIVILYNPQSHKQRQYLEHDKPVICLAVSKVNRYSNSNIIVASSQIVTVDKINEETPAIRIWNPINLHTIAIIRGQHKIGVHLMSFTNSSQYLVTAGLIFYSPIVVYSVNQNFKPIYSVSCLHPTVQISTLYGIIDKKSQDFVIATLYGVKYFQVIPVKNGISIQCTDMNNFIAQKNQGNNEWHQFGNFSPITSCSFIYSNYFQKYLSSYDHNLEKLIITGHEKGQVVVWCTAQKTILYELCVQSCQIVNIIPSKSHILICSNSSVINFWDIDLKKNKKIFQIDITTFDMQLQGHQICGIVQKPFVECDDQLTNDFANFQYIVGTTKGDFFLFNLQQKQDHSLRYKLTGPRFQSKKIDKIIPIDWISSQILLQRQDGQNLLIFGGINGNLYIVNTISHQIISTWKIGEPIVTIDAIQTKQNLQISAATSHKRVYSSTNFLQKNQKYQFEKNIKCIKLIKDNNHLVMILGLEGGYMHFVDTEQNLQKKNTRNLALSQSRKIVSIQPKNDQVNQSPNKILVSNYVVSNINTVPSTNTEGKQNLIKKIKLASSPTQIVSLQKKMLLVSTQDNIFYTISLKDFHFKAIQPHVNPLSCQMIKNKSIKSYYCLSQLGKGFNKSVKKVYKLPFLMGKLQKLLIEANIDNSINLWKNPLQSGQLNQLQYNWHASRCINFAIDHQLTHFYSTGYKDGMIVQSLLLRFYQPTRTVLQPFRALVSVDSVQSLSRYQQSGQYNNQIDLLIQRQIEFSTFNNEITTKRYDQHIQIRGIQNQTLCRIFEGMSEQWKIINKLGATRSPPKISLKLDYVYGVQTDNKRSTVLAINFPQTYFVYFISNLVIVYDPRSNGQKIYKGHRYKITCIDKILMIDGPCGSLVEFIASGESSFRPIIKIWHPLTLQTIKTIHTAHTQGIIRIFCTNKLILSFGISCKKDKLKDKTKQKQKDRLFSLQLSEISSGCSIASRHVKQYILSMAISPLRPNYFITTGQYNVTVWVVLCGNIEKYSVIQTYSTVTCCLYRLVQSTEPSYNYNIGSKDDGSYTQQIIVGSQNGQLGIICNLSKYLIIEQKAHLKAINCITYVNQIIKKDSLIEKQKQINNLKEESYSYCYKNKNIRYIVTCSEDQTLKIWNKKFEIQFQQEVRKIEFDEKNFLNSNSILSNPPLRKGNNTLSLKNRSLYKNVSIQSLSSIYDVEKDHNLLSLLIATRNGEVLVLEEYSSQYNKNSENKNTFSLKAEPQVKSSFDNQDSQDQIGQVISKNQPIISQSRRSSKGLKQVQKIRTLHRKSINNGNKLKMRHQRSSNQESSLLKKRSFDMQCQNDNDSQRKMQKSLQSIKFVLYLRNHSSQICTSTRPQFISKQKGGKVLFSHHPKLQLIATLAEDQNLFFWDTQRNLSIFHIVLGYMAEPTVLKFTKDGDILIVGYSDGYVMFLDSQISKSHQGKGDEKFILPTLGHVMQIRNDCPVLAIQQSQSGDYLAISFNNKKSTVSDQAYKKQTKKSSHILIYLNKSRERTRNHANNKMQNNNIFEMVMKIPCQTDSVYNTSNNNEYGVAAHTMMFTQNQGKTYLLIYEQLVNMNTHKTLDLDKDGNYVVWDVNTSTMIANTDQISSLLWKRICIPNSIYAKYLLYPNLTKNQQCATVENINSNANLYTPSFTAMLNLPSHIFLGSLNGDLHIAQTSCLQYDKMLISNPRQKQLFVAKTYPAHCSQVNHIQFNLQKNLLFTSGLSDCCILKWKIEGDFNIQLMNTDNTHENKNELMNGGNNLKVSSIFSKINQKKQEKEQKQQQNKKIYDQFDIFKQVPHFQQIQEMKVIYRLKQIFSWASIPNNFNYQIFSNKQIQNIQPNNFIKNLSDFIQTVRITNIIGRNAHNNRNNLWYDQKSRIVYNTGHAIVVLKPNNYYFKTKKQLTQIIKNNQLENLKKLTNNTIHSNDYICEEKQFIHITNGRGEQLCQQINCTCISSDRKLIYAGHNGTSGSVTVWNVSTKLRLKTIILKQIMIILKIRVSYDNKTLLVYGINEHKNAYLMLICLQSCYVVGIVNFLHEKVSHIKDIAFYPKSNYNFVTCGVNDTLSWKLQGNQLTYSILSCVTENSNNLAQNYSYGSNYAHKSINVCIAFLPKSSRVITGCQDGNLLLWGQNSFQRREHADVVMVLKTAYPNILLSGSRDGSILLWMEETNGGGLTLCSKLNLRNQSSSLFRAHGMNSYKKYTTQSQSLQQEGDPNTDDLRTKMRKVQKESFQTNKKMQKTLKDQKQNADLKLTLYQELCIQSIEISDIKDDNQFQDEQKRKQIGLNLKENNFKQNDRYGHQGDQKSKTKNDVQMYSNQLQGKLYLRQNFSPRKWKVLIGTTSGNIYQSTFSQYSKSKIVFNKSYELLQVNHDHQVPKSFFFSKTDKEIYQITCRGYFCCRRIADSKIIFQQNFDRQTIDMIYSPKNNLFFIIFKTEIRSYPTFDTLGQLQNSQQLFKPLGKRQIKFITHAQISAHQKVLAVGVTKNSDKTVNIEVYDVSKKDEIKFLLSFAIPTGQCIQFIDFSSNNKIVLVKLVSTDKLKIITQQLTTLQNIKQDLIAFTQWNNQAQNLYDRNGKIIQKVQQIIRNKDQNLSNILKGQVNKLAIIRISQISDNIFILIDNQGNLYAFNNQIKLIGQSRIKISQPSIIKFSHSKKLLGIGSKTDRNIVIFDIGLTHLLKGFS